MAPENVLADGAGDAGALVTEQDMGQDAARDATALSAPTTGDSMPTRILLVEDHADTATVMAQLLRRRGYSVDVAGSMQAAVAAAEREEFDLLISDIGLPDGNGLDLLPLLRRRDPHLQGIALTGFGTEADIRQSRATGYLAHVTKPIDFARLGRVIHDACLPSATLRASGG
jgi:CheY-like chemotaxis protein